MSRAALLVSLVSLLGCASGPSAAEPATTGSLELRDDRDRPLTVYDFGDLQLLPAEEERTRYLPSGSGPPAAIHNGGLTDVQFDGWVLRLEPGSHAVELRYGPVGGHPLQPTPVEAGSVVRLEKPWPIEAGASQGIGVDIVPTAPGPFAGTVELLDGETVVFRIPFRGRCLPVK